VNYIYSQLSLFLIYNIIEKVFQQEFWLLQYEYLQIYLSVIHIRGEMLIIIYILEQLRDYLRLRTPSFPVAKSVLLHGSRCGCSSGGCLEVKC
jgi:hypothetical protein